MVCHQVPRGIKGVIRAIRHDWGIEAVATDPIEPNIVYAAVGMYTNSWSVYYVSLTSEAD